MGQGRLPGRVSRNRSRRPEAAGETATVAFVFPTPPGLAGAGLESSWLDLSFCQVGLPYGLEIDMKTTKML